MGSKIDKIKGYANEAAGMVKQGVGGVIGNEQMEAEGIAQEAKGEGQKAVGKVKGTIKGVADKVADKAHENL